MSAVRGANLALRFALELAALAAVGYWGWTTADGVAGWVLAVAAVAAVAVVWGVFVAPKRRIELARPARFAIEVAVWAAAGAAVAATGRPALGVAFFVVATTSGALNWVWA